MNVEFLNGFEKDLSKTNDKQLAKIILNCIRFDSANHLSEIPNIKKISGHPTAYRYRKGKYRIGFFFENGVIVFAAFAPRDKIYRKFPLKEVLNIGSESFFCTTDYTNNHKLKSVLIPVCVAFA
jgi:mRNA interferase RelE/StbE